MNESFNNFKKRTWRNVFIKCSLAALATAFLAVDAVLLPCLLNAVHLHWAWYVLIAFGALASGFGVAFAFLRVNDCKIAQHLDAEFNLHERVQTAYVYRAENSEMLTLQRGDCDSALRNTPLKSLKFGNVVLAIALAVLLALSVAALPVIAAYADVSKQGPPVVVDPPRDVTDWEWKALDDLIDYVKASEKADAQAKSGMVTALEGLRGVLQNGVTQSGLQAFVRNTVTEITNAVSEANDADGVSEEQQQSNNEECDYVIDRLYEIFSLQQESQDPNKPSQGDNNEEPVSPGNNTGTGELVISGIPFFDPDVGYVSSGDVETRDKYYNTIRQAMLEGTISRSEWEYIVATYFADLQEKDN